MNALAIFAPTFIMLIGLLFLLPIFALIDILRSDFKGNDKIIWVLMILFLNLIGALIYLAMGRQQKIKNN